MRLSLNSFLIDFGLYPLCFNSPKVLIDINVHKNLSTLLFFFCFECNLQIENHPARQVAVISSAVINFCKLSYKLLKVWITCDHKCCNMLYYAFCKWQPDPKFYLKFFYQVQNCFYNILHRLFRQVGLPSVIIKICLLFVFLLRRISIANSNPATVFV